MTMNLWVLELPGPSPPRHCASSLDQQLSKSLAEPRFKFSEPGLGACPGEPPLSQRQGTFRDQGGWQVGLLPRHLPCMESPGPSDIRQQSALKGNPKLRVWVTHTHQHSTHFPPGERSPSRLAPSASAIAWTVLPRCSDVRPEASEERQEGPSRGESTVPGRGVSAPSSGRLPRAGEPSRA